MYVTQKGYNLLTFSTKIHYPIVLFIIKSLN